MVFKQNPVYNDPKLMKRVYDLRSKGESFQNISSFIFDEFDTRITLPTLKNIYERYIAKNMVVQAAKEESLAGEIVPDYQKKMDERFNRIAAVTDDLMDTLTELKKDIPPLLYVKFIPTILAVCREILNQLNYIKKEQTQVLINQKNVIYSPLQIMNILNTEMQKLEKEGKIEIKKVKESNGRVLTEGELGVGVTKTEEEIEMEKEIDEQL